MSSNLEFHPKLKMYVPSSLEISKEKYEKRLKECKLCVKHYDKDIFYKFRLDSDLFFDVYYWIKPDSLSNTYAYDTDMYELCSKFECKPDDLLSIAKEIGMSAIVDLTTYHAVWLHYFLHRMMINDLSCLMNDWDSMYQSKHVHAKNELHFLIHLLLTSPERKQLMQEIREFSMCPPIYEHGVCGYEYKEAKNNFDLYKQK